MAKVEHRTSNVEHRMGITLSTLDVERLELNVR